MRVKPIKNSITTVKEFRNRFPKISEKMNDDQVINMLSSLKYIAKLSIKKIKEKKYLNTNTKVAEKKERHN